MDVYFAPMACSLATRITLDEARLPARFLYVDIHTDPLARRLEDGSDYHAVNPMGQVPAVRTDDGELVTENAVVLQYVGGLAPEAGLVPAEPGARRRLQGWLNFVATELHKATYVPLLDRHCPEDAKAYARRKLALRFGHLDRHLSTSSFLLDRFTVADAYLLTVLTWSPHAGIDLAAWPAVAAYLKRMRERPSVGRALAAEWPLYAAELERMKANTARTVVPS